MELDDLLLDGSLSDETVDRDRILLSDAVGTVRGLLLDSRVPPRIEMDNIVGSGEVQSQSARFQTDEEERHVARLELTNQFVALFGRRGAVEIEIFDATLVERLTDECQMRRELTEDQRTVVVVMERVDHLQEYSLLGRRDAQFLVDELGVAGRLTQSGELSERLQWCGLPVHKVDKCLLPDVVVERPLLGRELHLACDLRLLGQLVEHVVFCASQDKRRDDAPQHTLRAFVVKLLDGCDKTVGELLE